MMKAKVIVLFSILILLALTSSVSTAPSCPADDSCDGGCFMSKNGKSTCRKGPKRSSPKQCAKKNEIWCVQIPTANPTRIPTTSPTTKIDKLIVALQLWNQQMPLQSKYGDPIPRFPVTRAELLSATFTTMSCYDCKLQGIALELVCFPHALSYHSRLYVWTEFWMF
jgi:hypothetical protein